MKISVIVTNWNGLDLLKNSLPVILKNSPEANEIIVVDDGSTDESTAFILEKAKQHNKLKLIANKTNLGFIPTSNLGVSKANGDYVVMLNNDIYPQPDYIKNSLKHFNSDQIYGVGFSEIGQENWPRIFWSEGYLQYEPIKTNTAHISAWLSGGSSIVKKNYFQKLGGFDQIYEPFYSEDLDLGYRAWKSGYKLIWSPECKVIHKHESTTSKLNKHFTDYVKERNRLLVVLRNITDPSLLASNRRGQIFRTIFGPNYIKIIISANKQIKKFPKPIVFPKLTDRQIFTLFNKE